MKQFKTIMLGATLLFMGSIGATAQTEKTPAFPGAEGFGKYTTGGRGGKVYHVTNLDDSGTGSLRWANSQPGPRTIVFDVSGTIYLKSALKINANTTIAGQTAPGDGICIAGYQVTLNRNNIIRYVRFRPGDENAGEHDGLGAMDSENIIVDHCSVSWSVDECLSVYGSKNFTVQWCISSQSLNQSTHAKGNHGYGGNWGGSGASYHHNLIAHHVSRTPRLGPRPGTQTDERMDMRNNVIYNWTGNGCYGGEGMNVNIVNNYYKPGPGSPSGNKGMRIAAINIRSVDYCLDKDNTAKNISAATGKSYKKDDLSGIGTLKTNYVRVSGKDYAIDMENNTITIDDKTVKVAWNSWKPMLQTWGHLYVTGNINTQYDQMSQDNWTYGIYNQIDASGNDGKFTQTTKDTIKLENPIPFMAVTTHKASKAYQKVLSYVGASLHRDALDEIIVNDVREGKATFTGSGNSKGIINHPSDVKGDGWDKWPTLNSTEAPKDSDGDGMPDEWETAHGLNPSNAADGNQTTLSSEGYTNLEVYMNSLVEEITKAQNEDGTLEGDNGGEPVVGGGIDIPVDKLDLQKGDITIDDSGKKKAVIDSEGKADSFSNGDQLSFNLNCTTAGTYTISFDAATTRSDFKLNFNMTDNGSNKTEIDQTVDIANTGAWQTYKSYSFDTGQIATGPKKLVMTWLSSKGQYTGNVYNVSIKLKDASGINEITNSNAIHDGAIYNLYGVRMTNPTKGIYIQNGKKIIIK